MVAKARNSFSETTPRLRHLVMLARSFSSLHLVLQVQAPGVSGVRTMNVDDCQSDA